MNSNDDSNDQSDKSKKLIITPTIAEGHSYDDFISWHLENVEPSITLSTSDWTNLPVFSSGGTIASVSNFDIKYDSSLYSDPIKYKLSSNVDALLHASQSQAIEEEGEKDRLQLFLETQNEVIELQKQSLEYQQEHLKLTKKQSQELSSKIDHLQSELSKTEQRLKKALESKYILSEKEILESVRQSISEYTLVFSKIGLGFSALLLLAYYALDVEIMKP